MNEWKFLIIRGFKIWFFVVCTKLRRAQISSLSIHARVENFKFQLKASEKLLMKTLIGWLKDFLACWTMTTEWRKNLRKRKLFKIFSSVYLLCFSNNSIEKKSKFMEKFSDFQSSLCTEKTQKSSNRFRATKKLFKLLRILGNLSFLIDRMQFQF